MIIFFNSLAPGKFEWNFRCVIFKQIQVIDGWGISCHACEISLIWMSLDFIDGQSTLVQVMAWCRQATSHYLSQCWPSSLSPIDITRPQWVNIFQRRHFGVDCNRSFCYNIYSKRQANNTVNTLRPGQNVCHFEIFKCNFLRENICNLVEISPKFVPKGPTDNNLALVQIMIWHIAGDKPLPELWYHMAPLGHNELTHWSLHIGALDYDCFR